MTWIDYGAQARKFAPNGPFGADEIAILYDRLDTQEAQNSAKFFQVFPLKSDV